MDTPPPRPRHHPPVEGEIRRTDADLPDGARRRRLRTAGVAARIAATRPAAPSLVGSAAGAIARLRLTIPSYAVIGGERNPYGVVYRDLLAKLPAQTSRAMSPVAASTYRARRCRWCTQTTSTLACARGTSRRPTTCSCTRRWASRPVVYLPTYAHGPFAETLAATDRRNAEIWEGLGYDVVALGDFHPFAVNLGAAHCIKKYLARAWGGGSATVRRRRGSGGGCRRRASSRRRTAAG